jgi:hypothetical protein
VLSQTKKKDYYNREPLINALAKLGDREQQQQIYCQTRKSFGVSGDLVNFEYIGGGFSVRLLNILLDSDAEFDKKLKQPIGGDVALTPPSWSALRQLPRIVPNPPVTKQDFFSTRERDQAVQIWKYWIAGHQTEIDKLQPNGEGVIFTKAGCQRH